ncbi:phage minor tail protein L [Pseudomonas typographi]|uniref:Phage minor tail protein L n=1 Tax=Pseudomonas typographi TaxID=2715964 RepID=A0ABR7Z9N8_9PSED|nr:phage minor tail protein L [Pseudomonas typographi]MBD1590170.1 phage minor tail protein L [Pseudomonas typographi]MBD1602260.1 phage minor tail protein L [Pseudomonas typographi]
MAESIYEDVQKLEPGQYVELFELDLTAIDGDVYYFHGYTRVGGITWQGVGYSPWPIKVEGMGMTGEGQQSNPTLSVGNVTGFITALCATYKDLVDGKITRHRTLGRYLDAVNFPEGNPEADPDEHFTDDVYTIDQKQGADPSTVSFVLKSPLIATDRQLPGRQIVANCCQWLVIGGYRGTYCAYTGSAYFTDKDVATDDPAKDMCSGTLTGCKLRFGANNQLRYGSYPSAGY